MEMESVSTREERGKVKLRRFGKGFRNSQGSHPHMLAPSD